jgi:hypothetical protein
MMPVSYLDYCSMNLIQNFCVSPKAAFFVSITSQFKSTSALSSSFVLLVTVPIMELLNRQLGVLGKYQRQPEHEDDC